MWNVTNFSTYFFFEKISKTETITITITADNQKVKDCRSGRFEIARKSLKIFLQSYWETKNIQFISLFTFVTNLLIESCGEFTRGLLN